MRITDITSFAEAVAYINETPKFTKKNTAEDTKTFLRRLGSPDRGLRILHVAGTNGKGSVCAYLRSVLEAAGYRVAVFTSPHLVTIRERFVVGGEMIAETAFLEAFRTIAGKLDTAALERGEQTYHPTYFEFLFFIAMLVFAKEKPDFCILETGLGGRLDATNAVSEKELSVITHISLDHTEYLGDTVEKIAGEKAGIIHAGAPVVFWETCEAVKRVFLEKAAEVGAEAYSVSKKDYQFLRFGNKSIDFSLCTEYYNDISLKLNTIAAYQMENAALAVRALEILDRGRTIRAEAVKQGIAACFWAGRMEEVLPEVFIDGAHNADGVRAFLETVAGDGHDGKRTLLFGVVKDKDYESMAKELVVSGLFERVAVAPMQTGRTLRTEALDALFGRYPDCGYQRYDTVEAALRELLQSRRAGGRIYAAGSLYLVGEIKELLRDDKF